MTPTPMEPTPTAVPSHRDASPTASLHSITNPHPDAPHTDVTAITSRPPMDVTPMDPAHIAEARPASARGIDHPTRHDGSAPAG
jgi:hypothetical protein